MQQKMFRNGVLKFKVTNFFFSLKNYPNYIRFNFHVA